MTDSAGPGREPLHQGRPPSRIIGRALLRALASAVALLTTYYLLPLNRSSTVASATMLVIGLVVLGGLVAFQAHAIVGSPGGPPRCSGYSRRSCARWTPPARSGRSGPRAGGAATP